MSLFSKLTSVLAVLMLLGCEDKSKPSSEEVLVVGTSGDNPPFEYYETGDTQTLIGFDIDLMQLIGKKLGKKVVFKDMDFHSLIPALLAKRIDLIAAGMTKNEERAKKVQFSTVYLHSMPVIVLPRSLNVRTVNDLVSLRIAAQTGSTHEQTLKEIQQKLFGQMKVVSMNKVTEMLQELKVGRIDGLITMLNNAESIIEKNAELRYLALNESNEQFSLAMRREEPLKEAINTAIENLDKSGEIKELQTKWFSRKMS